jgi:hypothetical protein
MRNEEVKKMANIRNMLGTVVIDVLLSLNIAAILCIKSFSFSAHSSQMNSHRPVD